MFVKPLNRAIVQPFSRAIGFFFTFPFLLSPFTFDLLLER